MTSDTPTFTHDYFISRRGSVADTAKEVAAVLEGAGATVKVQDHDFSLGNKFTLDIHDALKTCRHLIILHTADYDESFWTREEFAHFLPAVADSNGTRRIGLLRCDAAHPAGLLRGITRGDLTGETDPDKRREIILSVAEGRATAARQDPPIFGGLMPRQNAQFTGRDALLADLHATLSRDNATAALTQAAVHGLGGVGKTTLAREYIARHQADYHGIWWVTAADAASCQDSLAALGRALHPQMPLDTPSAALMANALDTIAKRHVPFLLVYDNAIGPAELKPFLPVRGARVLVTSRNPNWQRSGAALPVEELPEDDAVALLLRITGSSDNPGARHLARALGCLPLALDQAGAYVRDAMTGFAGYTARIEALLHEQGDNPDYPRSVGATFRLAIESVPPESVTALGLFCWLAPDAIPLMLLDEPLGDARDRAVAALRKVSLLTPGPDTGAGPSVLLHRLVATVMRTRLRADSQEDAALTSVLDRVTAAFPYAFNEPKHWPACRALLPHARALEVHAIGDARVPALATLLNRAGGFLQGSGDAAAALPLFRRALDARERVLGDAHPATLTSVNNLASCLETLGDAAAALPLYRRALEASERVLGEAHPATLTSVNNLAFCLRALGDAAAALPLYRRALEASERVLGEAHPDTLTSVNNLALCLQALGAAAAALPLFRRALEARERVLGDAHPATLTSVNNLAGCLETLGDAAAALPLFRRAAEGFERLYGHGHPSSKTVRANYETLLRQANAVVRPPPRSWWRRLTG